MTMVKMVLHGKIPHRFESHAEQPQPKFNVGVLAEPWPGVILVEPIDLLKQILVEREITSQYPPLLSQQSFPERRVPDNHPSSACIAESFSSSDRRDRTISAMRRR